MTALFKPETRTDLRHLAEDYDDLVRRYADDNGVLPDPQATEAAELAHRLRLLHAEESEHWSRLATEHREGS